MHNTIQSSLVGFLFFFIGLMLIEGVVKAIAVFSTKKIYKKIAPAIYKKLDKLLPELISSNISTFLNSAIAEEAGAKEIKLTSEQILEIASIIDSKFSLLTFSKSQTTKN